MAPRRSEEAPVVVRSLRLSMDLDRRLRTVAKNRKVPPSTLVRQWVEMELAALDEDVLVSRADVLRAVARVWPAELGHEEQGR
jgi:predicted DNA-binding protein